jgi:hypothetical protein
MNTSLLCSYLYLSADISLQSQSPTAQLINNGTALSKQMLAHSHLLIINLLYQLATSHLAAATTSGDVNNCDKLCLLRAKGEEVLS